jgi:DNA-binding XRE family transcriptional regulator
MDTLETSPPKPVPDGVRRYVSELLRAARHRAPREDGKAPGMTQQEVAVALGVPQSYISSWERGRWMPSIEYLWKLSEVYQCSMDDLVGRPGAAHPARSGPEKPR